MVFVPHSCNLSYGGNDWLKEIKTGGSVSFLIHLCWTGPRVQKRSATLIFALILLRFLTLEQRAQELAAKLFRLLDKFYEMGRAKIVSNPLGHYYKRSHTHCEIFDLSRNYFESLTTRESQISELVAQHHQDAAIRKYFHARHAIR